MHKPVDWPLERAVRVEPTLAEPSQAELLELEARYCSHGDTVHYTNPPKIFDRCEGSFLFDAEDRQYLDLQMWY
jgi:4-aminobutyrate aminotransferase/(S)-3-amino-2-methylpropionate transaminase